jgi:hypothetical protein
MAKGRSLNEPQALVLKLGNSIVKSVEEVNEYLSFNLTTCLQATQIKLM